MEENRVMTRNILILTNGLFLGICLMFFILYINQAIEINYYTIYLPLFSLLTEAVVFLFTFKFLKRNTRKWIIKGLVIVILAVFLMTAYVFIYEKITGYIFIYRYTYGFLLISFLIYPTILLLMLLLINKYQDNQNQKKIIGLTAILVVICMLMHGVFGFLGQSSMEVVENSSGNNTIYITDSLFLHGTESEYLQVNKFFMEYVGISREW